MAFYGIKLTTSDNKKINVRRGDFGKSKWYVKTILKGRWKGKSKGWRTDLSSERVNEIMTTPYIKKVIAKKELTPNSYQLPIVEKITQLNGVMVINADAGTGKTSTLTMLADAVKGKTLILAYNREIAKQIKGMGYNGITFHQFGLKVIGKYPKINKWKYDNILQSELAESEHNLIYPVVELFNMSRELLRKDYTEIALEFGINYKTENEGRIINLVDDLYLKFDLMLANGMETMREIDFTDMIYIPYILKQKLLYADYVFFDESQDINPLKYALIDQHMAQYPNCNYVFVGDDKQAINGWIGADFTLGEIKAKYNGISFPLSETFRTPANVLNYIKSVLPHVQTVTASKKLGNVEKITQNELQQKLTKNSMILCAHNAPLVVLAIKLLSQHIDCMVKGQKLAHQLKDIVKNLNLTSLDELEDRLGEYMGERIKPGTRKPTIEKLQDKTDCILAIAEKCTNKHQIIDQIDRIFSKNETETITLSSIHRAKGLENDNIFILEPELLSYTQEHKKDQGINITYVALTRTKENLYFIETPIKK